MDGLIDTGNRRREQDCSQGSDTLAEKVLELQTVAQTGNIDKAQAALPPLLDLADQVPFDREIGRRLLHLIQFCLAGRQWRRAMDRLRNRVEALIADRSRNPESGSDVATNARAERLWLMKAFLCEIHLALGDYDEFAAHAELPRDSAPDKLLYRNLNRVREKIVSDRFPDFESEKIFGIGLSRTGTTSLHAALNRLGIHSIHWNNPMTMDLIDRDDFVLFDAFTDIPVSYQFEWLYHAFPNSKFIFTVRDAESWEKSITTHYRTRSGGATIDDVNRSRTLRKFRNKAAYMHHSLYGAFDTWLDAREAYHRRVEAFFRDKPKERFLELNIVAGEGYDKLCGFLGIPVPDMPFPRTNAGVRPASTANDRS